MAMTELWQQKMQRFFNIYDANQSGTIQKSDFEEPVQAAAAFLGHAPGSAVYEEMMTWSMGWWHYLCEQTNKGDEDSITFAEFLLAMEALVNNRAKLNKIVMDHATFTLTLWDRDGDGMMSEEEFIAAHTAYNTKEAAAREAFSHLDRNGDQQLSFAEIIHAIEEYFTSDDPDAIGNWFIIAAE